MSKLLIDDYPIQVLPKLAKEIGLNESIMLQQIHYWLNNSKHEKDGRKWIYNSYTSWQEQLDFWSVKTIQRSINKLEEKNLIIIGNYNKYKFDKTKWYTIDYEQVDLLMSNRTGHNDQTRGTDCPDDEVNVTCSHEVKMTKPIPETTKTTTEITAENNYPAAAQNYYENHIGMIKPIVLEDLQFYGEKFIEADEIIKRAIDIAISRSAKNWGYVKAILRGWQQEGLETLEQVDDHEKGDKKNQERSFSIDDL